MWKIFKVLLFHIVKLEETINKNKQITNKLLIKFSNKISQISFMLFQYSRKLKYI